MNSIFGMVMELWILTLQETRSIHDSMNRQKIEFIAFIWFYYNYLKIKKNIVKETKQFYIWYVIVLTILLESKT